MKTYKVRKFQNGKRRDGTSFWNFSITIPTDIGKRLPDNVEYTCRLTEDGILFEPVESQEDAELPSWALDKQ